MFKKPSGHGRGRGRVRVPPVQHPVNVEAVASHIDTVRVCPDNPVMYETLRSDSMEISTTLSSMSMDSSPSSSDSGIEDKRQHSSPESTPIIDSYNPRLLSPNGYEIRQHKIERLRRPGYGSMGRKIRLVSNLYQLSCNLKYIYHYDVDIIPLDQVRQPPVENKTMGRDLCRMIIFDLLKLQKNLMDFMPVYDGKKNMFTSRPLPYDEAVEFEVPVTVNNRVRRFSVTIKPVVGKATHNNMISLSLLPKYIAGQTQDIPLDVRRVFETLLGHRDPGFPQLNLNTSFFFTNNLSERINLSNRAEMWLGYNQSVRFTEKGSAVVINITAAAFLKSGPAINHLADIVRRPLNSNTYLTANERSRLEKNMKTVRVTARHQKYKRKYTVIRLSQASARQQMFPMNVDGRTVEISVEKYFYDTYGIRLEYPNLPCFGMSSGKMTNVYLPIELCDIVPGQRLAGSKLTQMESSKMIRNTAVPVDQRFRKIEESVNHVKKISEPYLNSFGMDINLNPIKVLGRILDQPEIAYNNNKTLPNEMGVWDMRNQVFLNSAQIEKWVLLDFANCGQQALERFAHLLCKNGQNVGLRWQQPRIISSKPQELQNHLHIARQLCVNLVVIVLPDNGPPFYEEIKFFGDTTYNLVTQCIKTDSVLGKKSNDKLALNLCLKINSKLGGVNHMISHWPMALGKESVIVFGADVIHDIMKNCSIAAVVGVIDYEISKYAACCRVQSNPKGRDSQEIILDLKAMVKTILISYYRNLRQKPQKILFYRDGVSEGQFQHVLEREIPMIKDACSSLEENYRPPITFVIVQKRHQLRVRPENSRDGIGRQGSKNVPPGTVVDTDIVDPVNFDFYLVSHEGIQGTSKPAHYTVIFDENRVTPDVMQNLSYYLCHVYARSNRSISIPAPVKYADLLATRAKDFVSWKARTCNLSYDMEHIPKDIDEVVKSIEKNAHKMFFI